jgi:hypothetical protein
LPNSPDLGRVVAGTPVLGEENVAGDPEINRLGGARSNLFVLRGKGDLVSDLPERRLWRTPAGPPGRVRPGEACLCTTAQSLEALTGVVFLHRTIQRGLLLNGGAPRLRRSHSSALPGWLALPRGTRLNCSTKSGR